MVREAGGEEEEGEEEGKEEEAEGVEMLMLRLALRARLPKTCCSTRKARMESRSCGERKQL